MSHGRLNWAPLAICWLATLLCPVSPVPAQENAKEAVTEAAKDAAKDASDDAEPAVDEASLRGDLSAEIRNTPELRGSWAKVFVDPDKGLQVTLFVDSDAALGARQETQLKALVLKLAGPKFDSFGPTEKVPVQGLLKKITAEVNQDPTLKGVVVSDATFAYSKTPGVLRLKLNGKVAKSEQIGMLQKLCADNWWPALAGPMVAASVVIDTETDPNAKNGDAGLVPPAPPPGVAPPNESEFRKKLISAVQKDPALRGCWIVVSAESEGESNKSLRVTFVIDSDDSVGSLQLQALQQLVAQNSEPGSVTIDARPQRIPVSRLLKKLQIETEDDPRLAGVRVTDVTCSNRKILSGTSPQPATKAPAKAPAQDPTDPANPQLVEEVKPKLYLRVNGSVINNAQAQVLAKICNEKWLPEILAADEQPSKLFDLSVDAVVGQSSDAKPDGMVLRVPSQVSANEHFYQGVDAFLRKDFHKSLENLTLATQDDPVRPEIKYWRVAALIALKQNDRAQEIVQKLTPSNHIRIPYYSSEVLRSLERLNGGYRAQIRKELDEMVRKAVCSP